MSDTRNALDTAGLSGLGALLGSGVGLMRSKNKILSGLVGAGIGGTAGGLGGGALGGLRGDVTDSGAGAGAGAMLGSFGVLPMLKNASSLSRGKLLAALLGAPVGGAALGGFGGHMLGDDDEDRLEKIRRWGQAPQQMG
jgi:hypothetical protein